jgi:hypothetical protein
MQATLKFLNSEQKAEGFAVEGWAGEDHASQWPNFRPFRALRTEVRFHGRAKDME